MARRLPRLKSFHTWVVCIGTEETQVMLGRTKGHIQRLVIHSYTQESEPEIIQSVDCLNLHRRVL